MSGAIAGWNSSVVQSTDEKILGAVGVDGGAETIIIPFDCDLTSNYHIAGTTLALSSLPKPPRDQEVAWYLSFPNHAEDGKKVTFEGVLVDGTLANDTVLIVDTGGAKSYATSTNSYAWVNRVGIADNVAGLTVGATLQTALITTLETSWFTNGVDATGGYTVTIFATFNGVAYSSNETNGGERQIGAMAVPTGYTGYIQNLNVFRGANSWTYAIAIVAQLSGTSYTSAATRLCTVGTYSSGTNWEQKDGPSIIGPVAAGGLIYISGVANNLKGRVGGTFLLVRD